MTDADKVRLQALLALAQREAEHLRGTTVRLLPAPVDEAWARRLDDDPVLAERVDGFVARFGRLQDTLGARVIPAMLRLMLEPAGSMLDNLHRMEKLGLVPSVVDWIEARELRNRMVHEYVPDPGELAAALDRARELVPLLLETESRLRRYAEERLGVSPASHP